jgi:predicted Ser/Thr protein kinase
MHCPACQRDVPESSRYCLACGARVDASHAPTLTVAAADRLPLSDALDGAQFVPGTMLAGRYRIVGLLGRGGMGEVYRAEDLKLGQAVALKFLPKEVSRRADRLARFHQEVRLARQVSHPNVCRVYDIGETDAQHFLSMEYIDGEDLASLLRRIGRLPPDKALELARQLCAGLAAAHDRGVLHRDLKPANVLIDGRGRARLADFGLADLTDQQRDAPEMAGTPGYMAGRTATAPSRRRDHVRTRRSNGPSGPPAREQPRDAACAGGGTGGAGASVLRVSSSRRISGDESGTRRAALPGPTGEVFQHPRSVLHRGFRSVPPIDGVPQNAVLGRHCAKGL